MNKTQNWKNDCIICKSSYSYDWGVYYKNYYLHKDSNWKQMNHETIIEMVGNHSWFDSMLEAQRALEIAKHPDAPIEQEIPVGTKWNGVASDILKTKFGYVYKLRDSNSWSSFSYHLTDKTALENEKNYLWKRLNNLPPATSQYWSCPSAGTKIRKINGKYEILCSYSDWKPFTMTDEKAENAVNVGHWKVIGPPVEG